MNSLRFAPAARCSAASFSRNNRITGRRLCSIGSGVPELSMYTDGACRGNPGHSGAGVAFFSDGSLIDETYKYLGPALTNNASEYKALIYGLEYASNLKFDKLKVHMDSELVVKQMQGRYKVKSPGLVPLHRKAMEAGRKFGDVEFIHVRRELNAEADALANRAIDAELGEVSKKRRTTAVLDDGAHWIDKLSV